MGAQLLQISSGIICFSFLFGGFIGALAVNRFDSSHPRKRSVTVLRTISILQIIQGIAALATVSLNIASGLVIAFVNFVFPAFALVGIIKKKRPLILLVRKSENEGISCSID
jgi:multisubunit Na+/H+ antiporter MnhG subunit